MSNNSINAPITDFTKTLLAATGASSARSTLGSAASGANSDITSLSALSGSSAIVFSGTSAIKCSPSDAKQLTLGARDVDGASDATFGTLTSANTPSCAWSQPAGGLLTWDGGAIGATTPANAQFLSPVNAQTGTTYTILASDCGKVVTFNNAAAITVTLPQQSTTTTSAGFIFRFQNIGAGTVTFVKEGSETLTGNSTALTGAGGTIIRNSTTNWQVMGGSSIVNMFGPTTLIATITTSETFVLTGQVGCTCTLLGVYQQAKTIGTAGAFAIQKNGVALTGLGTIAPSTGGSYTSATGTGNDNVLVRGDKLTIVANGTLVIVTGLNIALDITQTF